MEMKYNGEKMRIVIGLGNPDEQYRDTFHNVGIMFVEYLNTLRREGSGFKLLPSRMASYTNLDGVFIVKLLTPMNLSGKTVQETLKYFKIKPGETAIAHDDSDLVLGSYKLQFKRGSAGHRGIASIIESLRSNEFFRFRIGIRKRARAILPIPASHFVLKRVSRNERTILESVFKKITEEVFDSFKTPNSPSAEEPR